jgi:hypothetical protein
MSRRIAYIAVLVGLTLCPANVGAQPQPQPPPQPELRAPADFRMRPITGLAEVSCDFRTPETALDTVAQGREIELVVTVKSDPSGVKYALTDAVQTRPDPGSKDPKEHDLRKSGIRLLSDDAGRSNAGFQRVAEYAVTLQVDPEAAPRPYDVQFTFAADNRREEFRTVTFFVAAQDSGKFVNASATDTMPRITAGADTSVSLTIANAFPAYRLTLRQLEITSEPRDLIDRVVEKRSDIIPSSGSKRIEVKVHGRHSLLRQLWPVEVKPKLRVVLKYDDGYRDEIERVPPIPIEFSLDANPSITFLLAVLSIVLGGLAGAWLRMTFIKLAPGERGVSTRARVIASLVLSAVIVLLVVLTKIELLAAATAFRIELHKPIATGLISFLVGLYDPARLIEAIREKLGMSAAKPVSRSSS